MHQKFNEKKPPSFLVSTTGDSKNAVPLTNVGQIIPNIVLLLDIQNVGTLIFRSFIFELHELLLNFLIRIARGKKRTQFWILRISKTKISILHGISIEYSLS
jgi:hypothetical protein